MQLDYKTRDPSENPVTVVITRDIVPGCEREFEEWTHRIVTAAMGYGSTGHTIITPDATIPERRVFVHQFVDGESQQAWERSGVRSRLLREAATFTTTHYQRAAGQETWFAVPGARSILPTARWKMFLLTLAGSYPLVLILSAFVMPWVVGWPLLARAAVVPIVMVGSMTYVIMPRLTLYLRGWLYPRKGNSEATWQEGRKR